MNIAINTLSLNRTKAGMGNYIYNLIHNLAVLDKKNKYYLFVSERNKKFFNINQENFKVINLGGLVTNKFMRLLWEQTSLPLYVKKHKIDVLHSPGFVLPSFSKAKNVLTIADMTFINHPKVHTLLKRVYFGFFMPSSIKKADKVISISKSTKKDILKIVNVNPAKIQVTHLASGKEFKTLDRKKARRHIKEKYNIDSPFILFVGMIEPRKNLKRILKAFSELKTEKLPHKFVVVGKKGWMYSDVFKTVKNLGMGNEVIFTGYVPDTDLAMFYNAADVLVYPCLYEGFGIPILEAMACGCPVITSNVSSMPEVAGNAALLINPKNIAELKQTMKRVLSDNNLRKSMIKIGKINIKRFGWKKTAKKTLDIFESLSS